MLAERLKRRMDEVGMSAREIAEQASVGRSFIYDILSGKSSNPTTIKLAAVADTLGVTVPFLINGEENREAQGNGIQHFTAIPFIAAVPQSGACQLVADNKEGVYYFRSAWLRKRFKSNPSELGMLYVQGDSMEPSLYHNDMVLVDLTQRSPSPPGVFALYDGIGIVIKRVALAAGMQPSVVSVSADNSKYGSYEQKIDELSMIGRVLWYAREM